MKKILLYIYIVFIQFTLHAQSDIRLNNYWWKPYIINPAVIDKEHLAEFDVAARKQWVMFPGAPTTFYASGTVYIDDWYTQFGLKVLQDNIGYTNSTNVSLTYAYAMRFYYNWRFNMGVALSFQSQSYDMDKISSPTPGDPTVYTRLINESNFNADIGSELTNKIWTFGYSSRNLFSIFRPQAVKFMNTNIIYGSYRELNHDYVNLGYGITGIQYSNMCQAEFNMTSYFKATKETNAFQLGLFYRTWSEMGFMFGIDLGKNMHLFYNYDYNVSGISRNSIGSHEIMLTYYLEKVYRCHNCWY